MEAAEHVMVIVGRLTADQIADQLPVRAPRLAGKIAERPLRGELGSEAFPFLLADDQMRKIPQRFAEDVGHTGDAGQAGAGEAELRVGLPAPVAAELGQTTET